jgi:hypothetical protein
VPTRLRLLLATLSAAGLVALSLGAATHAADTTTPATAATTAAAWPGCATFTSQPRAQARWIALGRPPQANGDHDGRVCEDLPATAPSPTTTTPCTTTKKVEPGWT